jgi:Protein of unknown function (DUF3500)
MSSKICTTAGLVTAVALVAAGCGSGASTTSTASASASASGSTSPSGGAGGSGGPQSQVFTAVNLNTNGDSPGGANTADVAAATNAFLATLDDTLRGQVQFDFSDNSSRQTWSNYPSSTVPRKGPALSDLTADQQKAADAVLQVALSSDGFQQDGDIRKADDYLNSLGGEGADDFGSVKDYHIAIYGQPSPTQPFMVQFGGHHLARNLTYNGDKVSQTPQFVGSEPTSFPVAGATVEPVKAEASAMFGMLAAFTDDQRKSAEITSGTFDDLLMGPGKDSGNFPTAEGLAVSDLNDSQRQLVTAAIQAYAGDLTTNAANKLMAKYQSELDQTRIGWSNNTGPTDESSYIRIDGPSVWIEFINTRSRSTPNIHYHSVYRDKTDDYGSSKPS